MRAVVDGADRFPEASMSDLFFERVALIGIGLIGSSLARVLRRDKLARRRSSPARAARRRSTPCCGSSSPTRSTDDPAEAVQGADLVVIATPLSAYAEIGQAHRAGI